MHIERKMIIVLSILLLISIGAIAVMIANYNNLKDNSNSSFDQSAEIKENNSVVANETMKETVKQSFQLIANGTNAENVERGNYVITRSTDWKNLWTKINYYSSPIPALPEVNFSKEMVVALFSGRRYSSGYSIEVYDIQEKTNTIVVFVKEYSPGSNCIVAQSVTYPFQIIRIPRSEKEIGFDSQEVTINC